jgi:hypothetical protein
MPLSILIALVVGGIAGIAVLTWAFGLSAPHRFSDKADARAAFAREYPDAAVTDISLCKTGTAALLRTEQGLAIVWPMGSDTTARMLQDAGVRRRANGLTLKLPDYTAPRINLRLDPEEAEAWANLIEAHS